MDSSLEKAAIHYVAALQFEDFLWSSKLIWRRLSNIEHSHKNIGLPVSATKKGQSSFKQQQRSEEKRRKRGIINLRAAAFNREVPGGMAGVKCSAGVRDNIGRQCQPFLLLCRSTIPLSISYACASQFTGVFIYWILNRTHYLQKKCFKRNKKRQGVMKCMALVQIFLFHFSFLGG